MTKRVTADHRATLERIFRHPHSGNVKVTLGGETELLRPPREKDVDKQTIVDLRRMLSSAGLAP